jgi:hypothetical protein
MLMGKYVDGVNLKLGLGVALVYNFYLYMIRFNFLRRFTLRNGTNLKPRLQRFASSYDADVAGLTEEEAEVTLSNSSQVYSPISCYPVSGRSHTICRERSFSKISRD